MQRVIGIVLGAIVTYLLLLAMDAMTAADVVMKFGLPVLIGATVSLLWPWVIGFFLLGRARDRREADIQKEVERQKAQKG